ncbi:MAG: 3-oxoacyl-ACP reductase FabG [Defluviitaleaceae bacterium]|nr:3-oxoacyl-ACP reductase FabG [Defluviitaleaceae bacterium]
MKLRNKVTIVTGGSQGIGLSIAELFAAEGAKVIVADIGDAPKTNAVIDFHALNVTDRPACKQFFDAVVDKYGKIDVLVNNAGITRDAMTRKMTDEQWDMVIDVNLNGLFNLTRYIGPHMQENKIGSIINISSIVGEGGNIGQSNYSATKAALIGLTKTWAKEFALKGAQVRVNAIAPGFILTDMVKTIPQEVQDKLAASVVLGKMGLPEDIAKASLFLASDDSAYITGHTLSVNGGLRM